MPDAICLHCPARPRPAPLPDHGRIIACTSASPCLRPRCRASPVRTVFEASWLLAAAVSDELVDLRARRARRRNVPPVLARVVAQPHDEANAAPTRAPAARGCRPRSICIVDKLNGALARSRRSTSEPRANSHSPVRAIILTAPSAPGRNVRAALASSHVANSTRRQCGYHLPCR